ncbi:MAG: DUF4388 domain-containing protein [Myxococcales bacterium]|nr:DUF4388 domain-containing protein [Myxococcales bacterium]
MAFHGDLSSYPLPELLHWLDTSRKTGSLQLSGDAGERKLFLLGGQLVAVASPGLWERIARTLEVGRVASGQKVHAELSRLRRPMAAELSDRTKEAELSMATELACEELYGAVADLTQAARGRFHWTEDPDRTDDEWVPVELGVRHLMFESLRWVDEQPEVERALPLDSMTVRARAKPSPDLPLVWRVILGAAQPEQNLGRLRLALGLPRSSLTRRLFDLLRAKKVEIDGAPQLEEDPIAEMLEKGAVLVRERQFEAAGLVFNALLASDPGDRRVREFARMVEREHVASLYLELQPIAVPVLCEDPEAMARLRPDERHVAALANGKWDVATIVLASHNRELETLKALSKLQRMGLVQLVDPSAAGGH